MPSLDELRDEALRAGFSLRDAAASPVEQFRAWFEQAKAAGLYQPRAMAMATVNALGRPAARMLVLAGYDERGFDFTTDGRSPKAQDLSRQPWAALVFHWAELDRQVRVEGVVEALEDVLTDAYFHQRARESQLAALASRQSEVIEGRDVLEERLLELLTQYEHTPVERAPYFAGYRLRPEVMEFWQTRRDHLNDRVRYRKAEDGSWIIELLAP
jgi:pyridoxamine 5'-phosphate oxidase